MLFYFNFSVIHCALLVLVVIVLILGLKWQQIKFHLFMKYGIRFEEKVDKKVKPNEMDYDVFIHYQ